MNFTNNEKRDMLEIYYASQRNAKLSSEAYLQRYPERRQPHRTSFLLLHRNLGEFGAFTKGRRRYNKQTVENEEDILLSVKYPYS